MEILTVFELGWLKLFVISGVIRGGAGVCHMLLAAKTAKRGAITSNGFNHLTSCTQLFMADGSDSP